MVLPAIVPVKIGCAAGILMIYRNNALSEAFKKKQLMMIIALVF